MSGRKGDKKKRCNRNYSKANYNHHKIDYKKTPINLVSFFCYAMLFGIAITLVFLFTSHGNIISKMFFNDTLDTGMDFFHSIEYTRGRDPYGYWRTLYPPLANLCFYLLFRLIPLNVSSEWASDFSSGVQARGTSADLRVQQAPMLLFIIFIILTALLTMMIIQKYLFDNSQACLVGLCMIFSYGMLYAYERGNIIIVSMLCSMFFVLYKDSTNKIVSELALIALAFAAGLKLYPALFGMLLLYDRQYWKATRTLIYGILLFIIPVLAFHGGISNISIFFEVLLSHTSTEVVSAMGYSFDKIVTSICLLIDALTGCGINEKLLIEVIPSLNIVVAIVILLFGFLLKLYWQRSLVCATAMLLYSSQGRYALIFLLIPILIMLKNEKELTRHNVVPFVFLVLSQMLLPVFDINNSSLYMIYGRIQFCMVMLTLYIVFVFSQQAYLLLKGSPLLEKIKSSRPFKFSKRKQMDN